VAPLTVEDIEEMLTELRGRALLERVRGREPIDRAALVQTIFAISRLITEHEQIAEFEINPLIVLPSGVWAVDARGVISS